MTRYVVAALVALFPAFASAQVPGSVQIREVSLEKTLLTWTEIQYVTTIKEVEVPVVVDGKTVIQKQTVTVMVPVARTQNAVLKTVKVTDATGKEIPADKLTDLLKDGPVVMSIGPIPEKHRSLCKDKTVCIELPITAPVK